MKELSLNILDVAKNSVSAGASLIEITLTQDHDAWLTMVIEDNGCGMEEDFLRHVTDPFCTTRTTRKVGLGLPLLKLAAEQTGGSLVIQSCTKPPHNGTKLEARFQTGSIDCMPLGDIVSTVCILIAGSPEIDFLFTHVSEDYHVSLDTRELKAILGSEISLAEPEIQEWIKGYLAEQYTSKPQ